MHALTAAMLALVLAQDDLSRKCGSEIEWMTDEGDAAAAAQKKGCPILWYVFTVANSPMDRKDVVDDYMKCGPWMMRDVVDLVKRRFVALRKGGSGDLAKKCGVARLEFVEPGIVFLTPDLKPIHRIDRLSTFQEDWLVDLLRAVLKKAGRAEPSFEQQLKEAKSPIDRARLHRRMRKPDDAWKELDGAGDSAEANIERGWLALRQGDAGKAVEHLKLVDRAEAQYLQGAALFMLNKDDEGMDLWRKCATDAMSPWAWKAAAELSGRGPFYRCFEEMAWVPDATELATSSTRPRTAKEIELVTKRSVALLLRTQRANGSWNDSNYEFGGKDSLPNVYMAGTALAVAALHAWRDIDATGIDGAIDRAWGFMVDEKNMATNDEDEVIWGYAYRLTAFARLAADAKRKDDCVKKMNEIVGLIEKLQKRTGIWRHEYEAPFTTATVLHSLWEAKQAGATVADAMMKKGADALASCRNKKGVISYEYPAQGHVVEQSAGRMPICELALRLCGQSDEVRLRMAVEKSFELHGLLERVRKYDDHADQYQNGGFFFWYDMVGRTEAIRRLKGERPKLLEKQRDLALSITEIDGCFVDSHELGKTYGTAMGLLTLKLCGKD